MERLTRKENGVYIREVELLDYYEVIDIVKGKCILVKENKLGEFEDFMEEQGFENLEIVKRQCDLSVDVLAMDSENSELKIANEKLWQENQALKERWEKLKEFVKNEIEECHFLLEQEDEDDYYNQAINARESMIYDFNRKMKELEKGGK